MALHAAQTVVREALAPAIKRSAMSNARGISTGRLRLRRTS